MGFDILLKMIILFTQRAWIRKSVTGLHSRTSDRDFGSSNISLIVTKGDRGVISISLSILLPCTHTNNKQQVTSKIQSLRYSDAEDLELYLSKQQTQ